ncbi:MAG: hypothetical protein SNJ64_01865 [Endomicrobiia bacterium]
MNLCIKLNLLAFSHVDNENYIYLENGDLPSIPIDSDGDLVVAASNLCSKITGYSTHWFTPRISRSYKKDNTIFIIYSSYTVFTPSENWVPLSKIVSKNYHDTSDFELIKNICSGIGELNVNS